MDIVLVYQYEAIYWQREIHRDEMSAAMALARGFCGDKSPPREVVSIAGASETELC